MKHLSWLRPWIAATLFLTSSAAWAVPQAVTFAGRLEQQGTRVNGTVSVGWVLFDAPTGGTALWSSDELSIVVVDGILTADLGADANGPIDSAAIGAGPLFLEVSVDGETLSPRARVQAAPLTARADFAALAVEADDASTTNGATASQLVTRASLAQSGGVAIPFANINPKGSLSGFVDGDTGTNFTAGAGLTLTGGSLSVAAIGTAALANGAVTGAKVAGGLSGNVAPGSITGADIEAGVIGSAAVQSLTRADFALARPVYRVQHDFCVQPRNSLMVTDKCTAPVSCPPTGEPPLQIQNAFNCETGSCTFASAARCENVEIGSVLQ